MDFLNRLKIGARLGAAFAFLLILLSGVAVFGAFEIRETNQHVGTFADNLVPSLRLAKQLHTSMIEVRRLESQHLLMGTEKDLSELEQRIKAAQGRIETALADYAKLVVDEEDKRNLQASQAAIATYFKQTPGLLALSRLGVGDMGKREEAKQLLFGESRKAFSPAIAAVEALWNYNEKLGDHAAQDAADGFRTALGLMAGVAALALVSGVVLAWLITRSITRPMGVAMVAAERIGAGDLSGRIEVRGSDETGLLLAALQRMNGNLVAIVGQVRNSSDSIATGSAQIATGNADLSQRTEEQASNLEQTAASMEQLSATVKQTPTRRPRPASSPAAPPRWPAKAARWWAGWWPRCSRSARRPSASPTSSAPSTASPSRPTSWR
jgi:methyl-accepting chemotaxis protein